MGYTFKSLCIRNFKYITNNKPLKFDFMNSNIVILDGQNGYGKTTLFDAIEVLVTGKIKHFNPNLDDDVLMEVLKTLYGNCDLEAGLNPAMGERNIALQRLYEFYVQFFMNEYRFASLIDRVAYDLSYGNPELKQFLTNIYNNTPGYDGAMRKLQNSFKVFFGSEHFTRILINELEQVMTEMVNKAFIII